MSNWLLLCTVCCGSVLLTKDCCCPELQLLSVSLAGLGPNSCTSQLLPFVFSGSDHIPKILLVSQCSVLKC